MALFEYLIKARSDMDDKIPAGEIKNRSDLLKWLDNFWYHHKIPTIIVLFSLFVVIVCVLQTCTGNVNEDLTIVYSGRQYVTAKAQEGIKGVFNAVMPDDFDGNNDKYTQLIVYHVMSEEQLKDMAAETDADGKPKYEVNRTYYSQEYTSYNNMLMTGEFSICLLDPWLYESLSSAGRLKRLTDVLGAVPESAVGECGVRLGDTAVYQHYDALKVLPEDTVLCMLTPYIFGATSQDEFYQQNIDMFRAIITFEAPAQ